MEIVAGKRGIFQGDICFEYGTFVVSTLENKRKL